MKSAVTEADFIAEHGFFSKILVTSKRRKSANSIQFDIEWTDAWPTNDSKGKGPKAKDQVGAA